MASLSMRPYEFVVVPAKHNGDGVTEPVDGLPGEDADKLKLDVALLWDKLVSTQEVKDHCKVKGCKLHVPELNTLFSLLEDACAWNITSKLVQWSKDSDFSIFEGWAPLPLHLRPQGTLLPPPALYMDGRLSQARGQDEHWAQLHLGKAEIGATELTGQGVTVALIDTGVHPAAMESIRLPVERGLDHVKNHQMGESLNIAMCQKKPWNRGDMHGTAVASLIAGSGEPSWPHAIGLAPGCTLVPIEVSTTSDNGAPGSLALALAIARTFKPDIIVTTVNTLDEQGCLSQITDLILGDGTLLLCAAGNKKTAVDADYLAYPACRKDVVAIGAMDSAGELVEWCNCKKVDVLVPGKDIYAPCSPAKNSVRYDFLDGTSMATGLFAGAVAVMLEHLRKSDPSATARQAYEELRRPAMARMSSRTSIPKPTLKGILVGG